MLKYSVPLMPTIILWWIINVSDRYMVTGFIGSAEKRTLYRRFKDSKLCYYVFVNFY